MYKIVNRLQDNVYFIRMVDGTGEFKTVTRTELLDLGNPQETDTGAAEVKQHEDNRENVSFSQADGNPALTPIYHITSDISPEDERIPDGFFE